MLGFLLLERKRRPALPPGPFRAEILNLERLEELARRLAQELREARPRRGSSRSFRRRLDQNADILRRAYRALADDVHRGEVVPPAAEWLLDNYHIVESEVVGIRRDLPDSYHRQLPKVPVEEAWRATRIHWMALDLIRHSDARLDAQRLERFLAAFQTETPLSLGELWAWPSALKTGLVENLRRLAEQMLASREGRRAAAQHLAPLETLGTAASPLPSELETPFVVELLARMREFGPRVSGLRAELEERLRQRGQSPEDAIRAEQQAEASAQVSIANTITSLRFCATLDWSRFVEKVSLVEQVLQRDPAAVYGRMDFASRDRYRQAVEDVALPTGEDQVAVALRAVERARSTPSHPDGRDGHVGFHLIGGGRRGFEKEVARRPRPLERTRRALFRHATPVYLGALGLVTAITVALATRVAQSQGASPEQMALVALLSLIPASELAMGVVQRAVAAIAKPRRLPRFDFQAGVPEDAQTMVVVPTLLDHVEGVRELVEHLEVQGIGNLDPHIHFGILGDFRDSPSESEPDDEAIVEAGREATRALNQRHGSGPRPRFHFFHRRRQWNPREGLWMGWERKRGKIEEFLRLLRGATDTTYEVPHEEDLTSLRGVRHLITLDRDTRLPRDTARTLVGIAAHPLNRPFFDPRLGRVTDGYGILQPRVSVNFESAAGSLFARLYAGHTGVDPYTTAVSDTYQDLFAEGIFTGKGLLHVEAFGAALEDRVPENALLSHDLFEGLYARTALVSDVEVVDDYPASVVSHGRRLHRWVRGDWQILFWLFPWIPGRSGLERNTLPLISRFKIFDNLRRSLVPPAYLAFLLGAWTAFPGSAAGWTASAVAVMGLPLLITLLDGLSTPGLEPARVFAGRLFEDLRIGLARLFITVTFLAYRAAGMLHAIVVTLVRLGITRRRLLEWETAATVARKAAGLTGIAGLRAFVLDMVTSPAIACVVGMVVLTASPSRFGTVLPFLVLWSGAPLLAYLLSRPVASRAEELGAPDRALLARICRRSWRYFEELVGPEDHWLPPDNFQEAPGPMTAHRTSPTNIGLGLLATLAAFDLGYIVTEELADRVDKALGTLEGLERHQGHLLNWYDTRTLAPLLPRYVSTVDSGNLAGALVTLAQGLLQAKDKDPDPRRTASGLATTMDVLAQTRRSYRGAAAAILDAALRESVPSQLADRLNEVAMAASSDSAADRELAFWARAAAQQVGRCLAPRTEMPLEKLQELADRALAVAEAMDFAFLYDRQRKLFAIGYRLADAEGPGRLDDSSYDLLASEARLASFWAIAKRDVPQEHWFHLGRPLTSVNGQPALLSWSATLFEYLMPNLLMRSYPSTLLDRSGRLAVTRQRQYGAARGVPWGISECAFAVVDRLGNYQYKAFGAPGLGLKRGLGDELVVAPYATALAAMVEPAASARNLAHLVELGLEGPLGLYEAIDYTPRHLGPADDPEASGQGTIIRAHFAHHQGMTVVALANVLVDQAMVRRFHADPRVSATELLLQERVPASVAIQEPRPAEESRAPRGGDPVSSRRFRSPHTMKPHAHFLSNGAYTVIVTNAGGGASLLRGQAVTRLREDTTRDLGGQFLYLRDVLTGHTWSATAKPGYQDPQEYTVTFRPEKAVFHREEHRLETLLEVAVSPEDDVEVRRLTLTNRTSRTREIEVTSYLEPVLGDPAEDYAHPAFGRLFLETEYLPESSALLCVRRPRRPEEAHLCAFHALSVEGRLAGGVEWETDRALFLGRGRDTDDPQALDGRPLSGTTGAVLDPVLSLRHRVRLGPGGSARLSFSTGVSGDRQGAVALAQKYHDPGAPSRAFALAFTHAQATLRHLGITSAEAQLFERLASRVLYIDDSLRAAADLRARNSLGQSGLWGHGISGDLPILLVRVVEEDDLPLVRQVLEAQEYWRLKGLSADMVILNDHPASYLNEMHQALAALLLSGPWAAHRDRPGGAFLLRGESVGAKEKVLLLSAARAVLSGEHGDLESQLERPIDERAFGDDMVLRSPSPAANPPSARPTLRFDNGFGGFSPDLREYVVLADREGETPLPWVNILASPTFGSVVSASGSSFTWSENSRENRLTPFANDPVTDPTGEAFFVRDEELGVVFGATPGALGRPRKAAPFICRHAAGMTTFEGETEEIRHELKLAVAPQDPVKLVVLTLENRSDRPRRLSVFSYHELCLGPPRAGEQRHVVTTFAESSRAIFATNPYAGPFASRVAFVATSGELLSATGDRGEFIGRNRSLRDPSGLRRRRLRGRFGAGLDPCAALQSRVDLGPREKKTVVVALGQGRDRAHAEELIERQVSADEARKTLAQVRERWDEDLDSLQVRTPDDSFDAVVNRWLLYQALSSRVWARTGYYQPGGAFGFRDQIQDVMAIGIVRPDLFREHLLLAASRQFREGDVQHWWHAPEGRGTRTRCSDDLLWLPHAVARYLDLTGDPSILDDTAPYLEGPLLAPEEHEVYGQPTVSAERGTVLDHCFRAIDRALVAGPHGLPLMGSGDWNDGMNRVGPEGRGESVWLGFFLSDVLAAFAPLCERRGDTERARRYRTEGARLADMLELAWDGDWYRRAYFDDGTPLGSKQNEQCRIDSISQAWSVLSGVAPAKRAERAMDAVRTHLVRRGAGLILLLDPPFDRPLPDPGYIGGYPPGIRENGGQYTHAALWTVMALARLGSGDEAAELFHMLNPINHARTRADAERYKVEPYVVAADISAHPHHTGRGGWTWYTGSAAWMYRIAIEEILGLRRHGQTFEMNPCIPSAWPGFSVSWRFGAARYEIEVKNPERRCRGVAEATLDGQPVDPRAIPLATEPGPHQVQVRLGA